MTAKVLFFNEEEQKMEEIPSSFASFEDFLFPQNSPQLYRFLRKLIQRYPHRFDRELFKELHGFFSLSLPIFRRLRNNTHLCRLVLSQYWTRKQVKRALLLAPERRHLSIRFLPTELSGTFGKKAVLGVLITLSFFDQYEQFDEDHLLLAIQHLFPRIRLVRGSRYVFQHPQEEKIRTLYVEFHKEDEQSFTLKEIVFLKKTLSSELKDRVQRLVPMLYTVRNEEQIMKNIIILSQELKESNSIPQMKISFESQTENALVFSLILVYLPISNVNEERLLQLNDPSIEISIERKQRVGYMENYIPKEALVFRVKISKTPCLFRRDFSIDGFLARGRIANVIQKALGDVRDYDGGLILKQQELFSRFQEKYEFLAREQSDLLEAFFYSITPIEKQATLPLQSLETLFGFVVSSLNEKYTQKGSFFYRTFETETLVYAFIRAEGHGFKKHLQTSLERIPHLIKLITSSNFFFQETLGFACILDTSSPHIRALFKETLNLALERWKKETSEFKILRLNFDDHPLALDPRLAGDEVSKVILQLLFEGLMRPTVDGTLECALAKSYTLSPDKKTYVFNLKNTYWSNGQSIQAQDFIYAWKKILSPDFNTPYSQMLYCIKNARKAKHGLIPLDEVGLSTPHPLTLVVEMEHPTPYFLELVAQPLFSPISRHADIAAPHWSSADGDVFVCNGPFHLRKNQGDKGFIAEKNPYYWDVENVLLSRVIFSKTNSRNAFDSFQQDEVDWIGRPTRAWEPLFEHAKSDKSKIVFLKEHVAWCTLNTRRFPLSSIKIRKALSLALNRQEFVEEVFNNGIPTFSPLLSYHSHFASQGSPLGEREKAQQLFKEGLEEVNLTPSSLPTFVLIHPKVNFWTKTAEIFKKQWKEALGIDVHILGFNWPLFIQKVTEGNYMMAILNWNSWVEDPFYTLSVFKHAQEEINFPKWESLEYQDLIEKAIHEDRSDLRSKLFHEAESILIREVPVIPILYEKQQAIHKKNIHIPINNRGFADFKKATVMQK